MRLRTSLASTSEEALLMPSLRTAGGRRSMPSGHSCWMTTSFAHIGMVLLLSAWMGLYGDFILEYSHILPIILRSEWWWYSHLRFLHATLQVADSLGKKKPSPMPALPHPGMEVSGYGHAPRQEMPRQTSKKGQFYYKVYSCRRSKCNLPGAVRSGWGKNQ
jgi:hypothetical protein